MRRKHITQYHFTRFLGNRNNGSPYATGLSVTFVYCGQTV